MPCVRSASCAAVRGCGRGKTIAKKYRIARLIVFVLFLCSLPLACLGCFPAFSLLPADWLPFAFTFQAQVTIENHTPDTLLLTPFTTTRGYPQVIPQTGTLRGRDYPLPPGGNRTLSYDTADAPLAGIAVCDTNEACHLLEAGSGEHINLSAEMLSTLPPLPDDWQTARLNAPRSDYTVPVLVLLALLPLLFLGLWVFLGKKERLEAA